MSRTYRKVPLSGSLRHPKTFSEKKAQNGLRFDYLVDIKPFFGNTLAKPNRVLYKNIPDAYNDIIPTSWGQTKHIWKSK